MVNALTILCNLIPLAGVAWFGWSALDLLAMYWFENLVVMIFALCGVAILHARGAGRIPSREIQNFCALYGMAALMFGLFLFFAAPLFYGVPHDFWWQPHMIWGVVGLSVNHAVAFAGDTLVRPVTPRAMVNRAMRRIPPFVFGMVVAILALDAVGSPFAGFVVLVVVKTALEMSIRRSPPRPAHAVAGQ